MPSNHNPWVRTLLYWHAHGKGGVRVPFRGGGRPTQSTIRTAVIERLEKLAADKAAGHNSPCWIFLVGGPGNGKSEAVETFVGFLDQALKSGGALSTAAKSKFQAGEAIPRLVTIAPADIDPSASAEFESKVGKLEVVQDASAMDEPGDSADALVEDMARLVTAPATRRTLYLCCVNRGVLASACRKAYSRGASDPAFIALKLVIDSASFRTGSSSANRPPCWPTSDGRIACWPLDSESLFEGSGNTSSPAEQVFLVATDAARWETKGACEDCDSGELCPFKQNAADLRNPEQRRNLIRLVRRGELASTERLNFRATLSLAADSIVGDWADFDGLANPCEWVHELVSSVHGYRRDPLQGTRASLRLFNRLTPQALFRDRGAPKVLKEMHQNAVDGSHRLAATLLAEWTEGTQRDYSNLRRAILPQVLAILDPAGLTPEDPDDELRKIEDAFSQGLEAGIRHCSGRISRLEHEALEAARKAAAELESPSPTEAIRAKEVDLCLRALGSMFAKRAIGTRNCRHQNEAYVGDFERGLRTMGIVNAEIRGPLGRILGSPNFTFGMMESFGRALATNAGTVMLRAQPAGIRIRPASAGSFTVPADDFPVLFVDENGIALTFSVYQALRLQGVGCTNSSLPPSVRAALDRVRHLRAGLECRRYEDLSDGRSSVDVDHLGTIVADPASRQPIFQGPA